MPISPDSRPVVTVSYTQTLDGRLATRTGASKWIGGPDSLLAAHTLRARNDAIVVGVGTVCADNPRLTVRLVIGRDPLRVVVDSTLRTPLGSAVLAGEAADGTVFAVTERAPRERREAVSALGATVLALPSDAVGRVDLAALLCRLRSMGIGSALVEGGASIITSLFRARLVDQLAVCIAPKVIGTGIEAIGDLGVLRLDEAMSLAELSIRQCGLDLIVEGRVVYPESCDG
jgi:diaminohydroxyphosphoribosylaminopyrimidine deaminase / 5-amino-6-(5-phosphoribosylamino)uracil reductase